MFNPGNQFSGQLAYDIPTDILKKLADYYHTSIDYLLYRTDKINPYPKSIVENIDEKKRQKNSFQLTK